MAQQHRHHNRQKAKEEPQLEMRIVTAVVGGIISILKTLFGGNSKRTGLLSEKDAAELSQHFSELEEMLTSNQLAKLAVSEADKLLDKAMLLAGAEGVVFADRLRNFEDKFDTALYQQIWQAHKLRNQLAHEVGIEVSVHEAKKALSAFAAALRTLGVKL